MNQPSRSTLISLALLAVVAVIIIVIVLLRSGANVETTTADADAQAFANTAIPAVFEHWNTGALAKLGDPSVYDATRIQRARQTFQSLASRLGPFVSYSGAHGSTQILTPHNGGEVKHASYDAELTYARGRASVHLDADKMQGKWTIRNASIQPVTSTR